MTLLIVTANGLVLRINKDEVRRSQRGGKGVKLMELDEGDYIVKTLEVEDGDIVLITTTDGRSIKFCVDQVRIMARKSRGIRGIIVNNDCEVIDAICLGEYGAVQELKDEIQSLLEKNSMSEDYKHGNKILEGLKKTINDPQFEFTKFQISIVEDKLELARIADMQIWGDDE